MQFEPEIMDEFMSWEQYHPAYAQLPTVAQSTSHMTQIPQNSLNAAMAWTDGDFFMFVLMWHSSPPADTLKEHC